MTMPKLPAGAKVVGKALIRTADEDVPKVIPKPEPVVKKVTPPVTPITDDKSSGGSPPPGVPPEKPVVVTPTETDDSEFGALQKRRKKRAELEAAAALKEKEFQDFRKSRGAVGLKPTKIGKSPRFYAPFGWNDRPSYAAQPVGATDERIRYGLAKQDVSPFTGEADEMELSKGQMFAGDAPVPYRDDAVGRSARLEEGIRNIQRKKEENSLKLDDLNEKLTERNRVLTLINQIMPRRADGSLAPARPGFVSEEARRLAEDFTEPVPGEDYSRLNYEAMMKLRDELKSDIDALTPEFRRTKLRSGQLMMAEDKYGSMYTDMDMSDDTDNPSSS